MTIQDLADHLINHYSLAAQCPKQFRELEHDDPDWQDHIQKISQSEQTIAQIAQQIKGGLSYGRDE